MLLWRYLSEPAWHRFQAEQRLAVSRIASFQDAFECMVPVAAFVNRDGNGKPELRSFFEGATRQVRNWASCWYADEHESIAMWELYVPERAGVAIAVLLPDLQAAAPADAVLGPLHYVRHDDVTAAIAFDREELWPFYKLWGFRHEAEVRLVLRESSAAVEAIDSSGKWASVQGTDVHAMVREARVLGANADDAQRLYDEVEQTLPNAQVHYSRAYPTLRLGKWLLGMGPTFQFEGRMAGVRAKSDWRRAEAESEQAPGPLSPEGDGGTQPERSGGRE